MRITTEQRVVPPPKDTAQKTKLLSTHEEAPLSQSALPEVPLEQQLPDPIDPRLATTTRIQLGKLEQLSGTPFTPLIRTLRDQMRLLPDDNSSLLLATMLATEASRVLVANDDMTQPEDDLALSIPERFRILPSCAYPDDTMRALSLMTPTHRQALLAKMAEVIMHEQDRGGEGLGEQRLSLVQDLWNDLIPTKELPPVSIWGANMFRAPQFYEPSMNFLGDLLPFIEATSSKEWRSFLMAHKDTATSSELAVLRATGSVTNMASRIFNSAHLKLQGVEASLRDMGSFSLGTSGSEGDTSSEFPILRELYAKYQEGLPRTNYADRMLQMILKLPARTLPTQEQLASLFNQVAPSFIKLRTHDLLFTEILRNTPPVIDSDPTSSLVSRYEEYTKQLIQRISPDDLKKAIDASTAGGDHTESPIIFSEVSARFGLEIPPGTEITSPPPWAAELGFKLFPINPSAQEYFNQLGIDPQNPNDSWHPGLYEHFQKLTENHIRGIQLSILVLARPINADETTLFEEYSDSILNPFGDPETCKAILNNTQEYLESVTGIKGDKTALVINTLRSLFSITDPINLGTPARPIPDTNKWYMRMVNTLANLQLTPSSGREEDQIQKHKAITYFIIDHLSTLLPSEVQKHARDSAITTLVTRNLLGIPNTLILPHIDDTSSPQTKDDIHNVRSLYVGLTKQLIRSLPPIYDIQARQGSTDELYNRMSGVALTRAMINHLEQHHMNDTLKQETQGFPQSMLEDYLWLHAFWTDLGLLGTRKAIDAKVDNLRIMQRLTQLGLSFSESQQAIQPGKIAFGLLAAQHYLTNKGIDSTDPHPLAQTIFHSSKMLDHGARFQELSGALSLASNVAPDTKLGLTLASHPHTTISVRAPDQIVTHAHDSLQRQIYLTLARYIEQEETERACGEPLSEVSANRYVETLSKLLGLENSQRTTISEIVQSAPADTPNFASLAHHVVTALNRKGLGHPLAIVGVPEKLREKVALFLPIADRLFTLSQDLPPEDLTKLAQRDASPVSARPPEVKDLSPGTSKHQMMRDIGSSVSSLSFAAAQMPGFLANEHHDFGSSVPEIMKSFSNPARLLKGTPLTENQQIPAYTLAAQVGLQMAQALLSSKEYNGSNWFDPEDSIPNPAGILLVTGDAGTGKSYIFEKLRTAYERLGFFGAEATASTLTGEGYVGEGFKEIVQRARENAVMTRHFMNLNHGRFDKLEYNKWIEENRFTPLYYDAMLNSSTPGFLILDEATKIALPRPVGKEDVSFSWITESLRVLSMASTEYGDVNHQGRRVRVPYNTQGLIYIFGATPTSIQAELNDILNYELHLQNSQISSGNEVTGDQTPLLVRSVFANNPELASRLGGITTNFGRNPGLVRLSDSLLRQSGFGNPGRLYPFLLSHMLDKEVRFDPDALSLISTGITNIDFRKMYGVSGADIQSPGIRSIRATFMGLSAALLLTESLKDKHDIAFDSSGRIIIGPREAITLARISSAIQSNSQNPFETKIDDEYSGLLRRVY